MKATLTLGDRVYHGAGEYVIVGVVDEAVDGGPLLLLRDVAGGGGRTALSVSCARAPQHAVAEALADLRAATVTNATEE